MELGEWKCLIGFGGFGAFGRAVGVLGALAILGLSLTLAPLTDAAASSFTGPAASSRARDRALAAYRRDRALAAYRHHERRGETSRARAAVVGGGQVSIEEIPWQVAVFAEFEVEGERFGLLCGGSIIDMSHVLTAAHCAFDPATGQPLTAASFVVVAGASSITAKEIKEGPTVQARLVGGARIHPYFAYAAGPGTPDDVAVLQLAEPLKASSAVSAIGLSSSTSAPPEGTIAVLSGFGEENPTTEELNGKLYSLGMALGFPRQCGGEADALFLCGSDSGGSACGGDSGGSLIDSSNGLPATLIGVVDIVEVVAKQRCHAGAVNGFVNLAAPEVRDFIEGSEAPPIAPRGGGISIHGVLTAGQSLTCAPGSWSNGPTFTYAFIDSANRQLLQQGSSPTYALSAADVGRTIFCQVQATNAGGTGVARTVALAPIQPAPPPPPPPPAPSGGGSSGGSSGAESGGRQSAGEPGSPASGGVLGSTNASISSAQIAALLGQELTPTGKAAKIATLLKTSGFTVTFKALEAGTAVINWYQVPPGAKLARKTKAKPILVAAGRETFPTAGTTRVKVKLTAAGKHLLKNTKSLKLTAKGTFTPTGKTTVVATKAFVLRL